jgi:hypothetical protein
VEGPAGLDIEWGLRLSVLQTPLPKPDVMRFHSTSSGGGDGDSPAVAALGVTPLPAALEHAAGLSRQLASASLADGSVGAYGGSSDASCGGAVVVVDERLYASAPDLTQLATAAEAEPQGGAGPAAAGAEPDIAAAAAAAVASVDGAAAAAGVAAAVERGKPPTGAKGSKQVLAAVGTFSVSACVALCLGLRLLPAPQVGSWT